MLEFYEYRPVWIFQKSDPDFYLDEYLGEDICLYFPDDTPRFFKSGDSGKIYFTDESYPEHNYRGFVILIFDYSQLYVANAELEIGWRAEIPFPYPGDRELFKEGEAFIDAWYWCQVTPGQLALQL